MVTRIIGESDLNIDNSDENGLNINNSDEIYLKFDNSDESDLIIGNSDENDLRYLQQWWEWLVKMTFSGWGKEEKGRRGAACLSGN